MIFLSAYRHPTVTLSGSVTFKSRRIGSCALYRRFVDTSGSTRTVKGKIRASRMVWAMYFWLSLTSRPNLFYCTQLIKCRLNKMRVQVSSLPEKSINHRSYWMLNLIIDINEFYAQIGCWTPLMVIMLNRICSFQPGQISHSSMVWIQTYLLNFFTRKFPSTSTPRLPSVRSANWTALRDRCCTYGKVAITLFITLPLSDLSGRWDSVRNGETIRCFIALALLFCK